jgi:hypothetical protein
MKWTRCVACACLPVRKVLLWLSIHDLAWHVWSELFFPVWGLGVSGQDNNKHGGGVGVGVGLAQLAMGTVLD